MKAASKIFIFIFILLQSDFLFSQAVGDYRSVATGTWATLATWESYNGAAWVAAAAAPTSTNGVITIQSPNVVTIAANVTVDQVVINSGATLQTSGLITLTIANTAGIQIQLDGTFIDGSSTTVAWGANCRWAFGATGTLIKTTGNGSALWQTKYNGGASTMPATANWILRKITGANPTIITVGAYYPNLTIENNTGAIWTTVTTSTFNGAGSPIIKGNFDLGGSGSNFVDFLNNTTAAAPPQVQGNTIIRAGNILRNYGAGLELQGDFTVSGTVNYAAGTGTRTITFSGGIAQSISGAGTLNIRNLTMSKSGNSLTLNRAITVDNVLTMTTGIINSSSPTNFPTINTAGTVAGANNSSFVNGPIRYIGTAAFTFPVGKGSDYQPLGYTLTAAGGGTFWTEDFNNGCTSGCLASSYSGINGAWSVTVSGAEGGAPNQWFVSCAENGTAVSVCGTGCGSNATLHVGANQGSYGTCLFCVDATGDCGAAYDDSSFPFLCGIDAPTTSKRTESPVINCTGQSSITISFNYIEGGTAPGDNATLWYYNGSTWSQIADMGKTAPCAGSGIWASFSTPLPASADNNPSVKIALQWDDNSDDSGPDPSFAVDDITLSTAAPTIDFTCEYFYADPTTTFNNVMGAGLVQIENCEYWVLTRNAGTASKNVTLTWDANSCMLAPATITDYRVARWDGAAWQNEGSTATSGAVPPAGGTITSASVSNFSPFTIGSTVTWPLPVELLSFTAKYNGKNVDLNWTTASEINNDYFTIEKTADGKTFHEVARVKGAGNSSATLHYSTKDNEPLGGTSYYRLKQTDYDGKYEYSNLAVVTIDKKNVLEIISMNEDENGLLNVLLNCICKSDLSVEIIDVTGKTVFAAKESPSPQPFPSTFFLPLNVSSFSNGLYLLKVSDGENSEWRKFVL